MPNLPAQLAIRTRQSVDATDRARRVIASYRRWMRAAPEIQRMYQLPVPAAKIRTRVRQEFERHRFSAQAQVIDVLLSRSQIDYQETMNFWRQNTHIMAYFPDEIPQWKKRDNFTSSFLRGEIMT